MTKTSEELASALRSIARTNALTIGELNALSQAARVIEELQARIEDIEKDASTMRGALEHIASGEVMRTHVFGYFATEQPEAATTDDMMTHAASALFFTSKNIKSTNN